MTVTANTGDSDGLNAISQRAGLPTSTGFGTAFQLIGFRHARSDPATSSAVAPALNLMIHETRSGLVAASAYPLSSRSMCAAPSNRVRCSCSINGAAGPTRSERCFAPIDRVDALASEGRFDQVGDL
jgi:hypothetical protein